MTEAKRPTTIDGVEHWRCNACSKWHPREGFYRSSRTPNGLRSQCKRCHTECTIRTRDPENARTLCRAYMRNARVANPDKFRERDREHSRNRPVTERVAARRKLNDSVRAGRITRPATCERCSASARVQGHHHDYSKPLDVEWLCSECHGREHRVVGFERVESAVLAQIGRAS